jgi:S1-C subfamily serine protease
MEFRLATGGGWADTMLISLQRTHFFIPASEFAASLAEVPSKDKPLRLPWMGVLSLQELTAEAAALITNLGSKAGVQVGQIIPDTPADKAGLKQADVIVGINGQPLERMATPQLTVSTLDRQLALMKPGQTVTLNYLRNGKTDEAKVTLEPMPPRPFEAAKYANQDLGFAARDLVLMDKYAGRATPMLEKGVVVMGVGQNSPVAAGQMKSNDLITSVNDKPTPDVATLKSLLEGFAKAAPKSPLTFVVLRDNATQRLVVTPPQK